MMFTRLAKRLEKLAGILEDIEELQKKRGPGRPERQPRQHLDLQQMYQKQEKKEEVSSKGPGKEIDRLINWSDTNRAIDAVLSTIGVPEEGGELTGYAADFVKAFKGPEQTRKRDAGAVKAVLMDLRKAIAEWRQTYQVKQSANYANQQHVTDQFIQTIQSFGRRLLEREKGDRKSRPLRPGEQAPIGREGKGLINIAEAQDAKPEFYAMAGKIGNLIKLTESDKWPKLARRKSTAHVCREFMRRIALSLVQS